MKTRWMILPAIAFLLPVFAQAQSSYYEDDLYYNPKKTNVETRQNTATGSAVAEQTQNANVRVYDNSGTLQRYDTRNVDEYNRRAPAVSNDDVDENGTDTIYEDEGQTFEYSERVRRFHNPKFTTHITDKEYLNIYIENGADVDIYYVDEYSSPWMSPFYYDSYYYPRFGNRWSRWHNNYGFFYDPWSYSSWGYYDPWYAGSYGWDPYFGGYYGNPYYGYGYGYGYGNDYYYYGGGWGGSGHHGILGGSNGGYGKYSSNRHSLNAEQRRFISGNTSGRSVSRATGSTGTRVNSRSVSGVTTRSRSTDTDTRSGSTRATTRSSSTETSTRSQSTDSNTRSRTSRSGSSTKESPSSSVESRSSSSSDRSSSYTPSRTSSSASPSYTPSSSSSRSSSSSSSSSSSGSSRSRSSRDR